MYRRPRGLHLAIAAFSCLFGTCLLLLYPITALADQVATGSLQVTVLGPNLINVSGSAIGGENSDGPISCGGGKIPSEIADPAFANYSIGSSPPPPWTNSGNINLTVTQTGHNNSCSQGYLPWQYTYNQNISLPSLSPGTYTMYMVFSSNAGGSMDTQQFTLP